MVSSLGPRANRPISGVAWHVTTSRPKTAAPLRIGIATAAFGVKLSSGRADGPNMNLTRDKFRRTLGAFGVLSMVLVGSACAGGDPPAAAVVTVSAAQALDFTSAPALTGKPVFSIKGKGIDDRFADGLELDIATLERLRVVEAEIEDPWEKRSITYRGVLMSDLVRAIALDGAAAMRFTALDDYEVTLPMKDLLSGDVLLATSADGERLGIEHGGPTRIVFLPKSVAGSNQDMWIWSVAAMVAE